MESQKDIFHNAEYRSHPAFVLDSILSPKTRGTLSAIFGALTLFAFFLTVFFFVRSFVLGVEISSLSFKELFMGFFNHDGLHLRFFGLFLIFLPCWLKFQMLNWFHRSYFYHVEALLERGEVGVKTPYTTPNYETNEIFFNTQKGDLLHSFLSSSYGREITRRAGLSNDDVAAYIASPRTIVDFRTIKNISAVFTLKDIAMVLLAGDTAFASFVFAHGIRPEDLSAASEWVERRLKQARRKSRYWGRVALGKSHGVGESLSYGVAYSLERYSTDLSRAVRNGEIEFRNLYGSDSIAKIESSLARDENPNVLLVGSEGGSLMDVVIDFVHDAGNGYTHSTLSTARLFLVNWKRLLSEMKTKQEFEMRLMKMIDSAIRAKHVIIVIDDLPGFLLSAQTLGSDIVSLLDPYAASGKVRFIATADMGRYHALLEQNGALRSRFEVITIPEPEKTSLTRILEDHAGSLERTYHILFTYPAVRAIRQGSQRYFVDAVMPDTALELMGELAQTVASRGDTTVGYNDVMNHIQAKTQIPVGTISEEERAKLEHLEDELHMHVVGQEQALKVIADALRRSRAGVRNPNKPIGTFLFLGPTGVGKTEAAKALARVFFGAESAMVRFDMSEFQAEDGLERLIGAPGLGAGLLSNQLREHPYSVVLLDEFEKTHPKVLDLFLQVFDEGIFHDAGGKKVNAQNTILIATSNAGSAHIREAVKQQLPLESVEKNIIDGVIAEGKFKPELLNRFDALVLFHPLTIEEYRQVAVLMLEKLRQRLRERNLDIAINDALIHALLEKGVDPDFGARPMNRAVQELVEQAIAKKIIHGSVKPGTTITFTPEDFQ
jgi:ATP-dependent Clp protease ATP-binding subunit ClpC